uniref:Uncharacterized protein n=1 Tax=Peromyscus maniculatus bairdii TaxID=230844 RepID=A0A8C8T0N3_PERMB
MADGKEPMAFDGGCGDNGDWEGRWNHVKKFLERSEPSTHPDFEPRTESLQFLLDTCKILITLSTDNFILLYVAWTLS